MGSASSKFKKYLQHGDEYAAMQVYQSSSELRKALEPNFSYGDSHNHYTPLHYAAKHGMKHLIRAFLNDLEGNPNKRNGFKQTSLHCVCQVSQQKSPSALERRSYSVILLLSWRGPVLPSGERERVDVSAQDEFGCTALHYAAQSGLKKCVEYLVAHGADLFIENQEGFTPCDLAMRENHHQIALFLESKMVFSGTPESLSGESGGARTSSLEGDDEVYCGLRAQDLQEAKDQLLVETADMLHIPLFTAEALLRHAEWSRESLLDQWMRDPVLTCQMAGVQPPYSALRHSSLSQYEQISREYHHESKKNERASRPASLGSLSRDQLFDSINVSTDLEEDEPLCEICCDLMDADRVENELSCQHKFCTKCWKNYLHTKIQEGNAHNILCPAFDCSILVPVQVIERHVSPQMARRYLKFDINAFVETNKAIKWCPYPACQRAVILPEQEQKLSPAHAASAAPKSPPSTSAPPISHAVDCGAGHFFCWECGGDAHAPCSCAHWKMWLTRCAKVNPSELHASSVEYQDAANCLWLITHSKPCPNCKSPIQKNDGCNHIKCSKCRYDFCWVCLESWKKHSTATGGYFRCNRFTATVKAEEEQGKQATRASEKAKKLRELNRFVHYYTRYKNHENSRKMEESLLHSAKKKREILQSSLANEDRRGSATATDTLGRNTKFYEDSIWELLKSRQILCGSYAYGFYLEDNGYHKSVFESMQNELEEVTERLSEMIARPYLRTPRRSIIQTYQLCKRKRQEFLRACYRGLVPPDDARTAELLHKQRKGEYDSNPWIRAEDVPKSTNHYEFMKQPENGSEERAIATAAAAAAIGICRRAECTRACTKNPRTKQYYEYCCPQCAHQSRHSDQEQLTFQHPTLGSLSPNVMAALAAAAVSEEEGVTDDSAVEYNMDLMIALEMSHLQMLQDGNPKVEKKEEDQELHLAIELSLKEAQQRVKQIKLSSKSISTDGSECRALPNDHLPIPSTIFDDKSPTFVKAANETVSSFLKSLAVKEIDVHSQKMDVGNPGIAVRRTGEVADGMFEYSDLHESGGYHDSEEDEKLALLKRSQSTGDIEDRQGSDNEATFIDSDHSCCTEKPEDQMRKQLSKPMVPSQDDLSTSESTSATDAVVTEVKRTVTSSKSVPTAVNKADTKTQTSIPRNRPRFVRQKSFEIDSDSTDVENSVAEAPRAEQPPPVASSRSKSHQQMLPVAANAGSESKTDIAVTKSSSCDKKDQQKEPRSSRPPKKSPGLTIQIDTTSDVGGDTDAESKDGAGIPKSPTLHISGVSISRTGNAFGEPPSPLSPRCKKSSRSPSLVQSQPPSAGPPITEANNNRNRSSSLIVPTLSTPPRSPGTRSLHLSRASSPTPPDKLALPSPVVASMANAAALSPHSASLVEGSRFTFPASAVTPLSSVLHIQDSNLSSDDFHEALFLEKSPKAVKKRRKSKKSNKKEDMSIG